ncbi:hypothetical protein ACFFSH_04610 [Streptomyces filamentosus]|uniref:hypothetical protein n=1 Tax=Streptomyces filamentosus TaxID=67294 RepID=UPI001677C49D|nr:hypothetical protein [Streptomyces filamentosus]
MTGDQERYARESDAFEGLALSRLDEVRRAPRPAGDGPPAGRRHPQDGVGHHERRDRSARRGPAGRAARSGRTG